MSASSPRVAVVGDPGVGKSLLVHLLCSYFNKGAATLPRERIPSTTGLRMEALVVRDLVKLSHLSPANVQQFSSPLSPSQPGTFITQRVSSLINNNNGDAPNSVSSLSSSLMTTAVEILEIGGNVKYFHSSCRGTALAGGTIDGVIFVYDIHNPSSGVALQSWYNDLRDLGALVGCKALLVVGTDFRKGSDFVAPSERHSLWSTKMSTLLGFVWVVEKVMLLVLSWLLFGFGQKVVSFEATSVGRSVEAVTREPLCIGHVEGLQLLQVEGFADYVEDFSALFFLSLAQAS